MSNDWLRVVPALVSLLVWAAAPAARAQTPWAGLAEHALRDDMGYLLVRLTPDANEARPLTRVRNSYRPDQDPHRYAERWDAVLVAERPMSHVYCHAVVAGMKRSVDDPAARVWVEGPYEADGSKGPEFRSDTVFPEDFEPGRYLVRVGFKPGLPLGEVALICWPDKRGDGSLELVGAPTAGLPLEARELPRFFPLAPTDSTRWEWLPNETKQEFFLRAPPELMVFVRYDLDASRAKIRFPGRLNETRDQLSITYPRAGEVLLVAADFGSQVLAISAEGTDWFIEKKALTTQPADKPVVPAKPRNVVLALDAVAAASPDQAARAEAARLEAAYEKADACFDDYWNSHHGGTPANVKLLRITSVGGRISRVEDYSKIVNDAGSRACGYPALAQREEKLFGKLKAAYVARTEARLAKLAARLQERSRPEPPSERPEGR